MNPKVGNSFPILYLNLKAFNFKFSQILRQFFVSQYKIFQIFIINQFLPRFHNKMNQQKFGQQQPKVTLRHLLQVCFSTRKLKIKSTFRSPTTSRIRTCWKSSTPSLSGAESAWNCPGWSTAAWWRQPRRRRSCCAKFTTRARSGLKS